MEYAGSASLEKEMIHVSPGQVTAGDVLIQGGFPGHAIIILDMAENHNGDRLMLLGQSFMPSQEFHLLKNLADQKISPWFRVRDQGVLKTPEWLFDMGRDARRFVDRSADFAN